MKEVFSYGLSALIALSLMIPAQAATKKSTCKTSTKQEKITMKKTCKVGKTGGAAGMTCGKTKKQMKTKKSTGKTGGAAGMTKTKKHKKY